MQTPDELFGSGSPVPAYLEAVAAIHREVLGPGLIALYLHGSAVQGDFRPGRSDIDILGVVSSTVALPQCGRLTAQLSHHALPVPAFGLELILCPEATMRNPIVAMPYEYALSTGYEWGVQVETSGTTSDILIHMQLCRQAGVTLVGAPAAEGLAPIPSDALRAGLMGEMRWHRDDLRGNPTDQAITNAVLNAVRSLYAAETGEIISKTAGGHWWLTLDPEDRLVADAIAFREGHSLSGPDVRSALRFVEIAMDRL